MEAQHPKPPEYDHQMSSALAKLPPELLYLIIDSLDTPSILSLRLTCNLAVLWLNPIFCKLLKSRKYFLHPYSFHLLEELSISPFAECVERIVIGTETFQEMFHLTPAEYSTTLTSTLPRFTHLRTVEIRDIVPFHAEGYYDHDMQMEGLVKFPIFHFGYRECPFEEEEELLYSQGFGHVSAEYSKPAFRKPPTIYACGRPQQPEPDQQLEELFLATSQACEVAKTAGVEVTDFRVTLMYPWGMCE